MFKTLVIDDEPLIREGLKTIIDWTEQGFEICGEAANGREGLAKVHALQPDLLILDLEMPVIGGLELLAELRKVGNKVQVLILTGYSEFVYAQKAINLGVLGYILKPIDEEELIRELKKAHLLLTQERKERTTDDSTLALAIDKLIEELCWGNSDPGLSARALRISQLQLPWEMYRVCLLALEGRSGREKKACREVLSAYPEAVGHFAVTRALPPLKANRPEEMLFLLKDQAAADPHRILHRISEDLHRLTGADPFIAGGMEVTELGQVWRSHRQARKVFQQRFITSAGIFVYSEHDEGSISAKSNSSSKAEPVTRGEEELLERLCMAVDLNNKTMINDLLLTVQAKITARNTVPEKIKGAYLRLFLVTLENLELNEEEKKQWTGADRAILDEVYNCENLQRLHEYLRNKLLMLSDCLVQSRPDGVIRRIIDYVQRNYHHRIKLENLAQLVNYNPAYLGKFFKNHTGLSFQAYLEQVRLTQGEKLLQAGLKVGDVARKVGYKDPDYFNLLFKKRYGVSPSIYKKSLK